MLISGRESSPAGSCRVKGWFEDFSNMYTLKGKSQIVIICYPTVFYLFGFIPVYFGISGGYHAYVPQVYVEVCKKWLVKILFNQVVKLLAKILQQFMVGLAS